MDGAGRARHHLRRRPGGRGRAVDGVPGLLPAGPGQRRDRRADPHGRRRARLPHQPAGPGAVDRPHADDRADGVRRRQPVLRRDDPRARRPPRPRAATRSCWPTPRSPTAGSGRRWSALLPTVDGVVLAGSRMSDSAIRMIAKQKPVVVLNRAVVDVPVRRHRTTPAAPGSPSSTWPGWGTSRSTYVAGPGGVLGGRRCGGSRCGTRRPTCDLRIRRLGPFSPDLAGGVCAAAEPCAGQPATAVVAYNDQMAIGARPRADRPRPSRCPQDVSVVGFDNIDAAGAGHARADHGGGAAARRGRGPPSSTCWP